MTKTYVQVADGPISTEIGDEVAILHLESGRYFTLDPVGSRVWQLIASPRTAEEIVDVLVVEFEVDRDRCEQDVHSLLFQLERRGLLRIAA